MVVVPWLACLPSTLTFWVRFPLKPTVCSVKFVFDKNRNEQKGAGVGLTEKKFLQTLELSFFYLFHPEYAKGCACKFLYSVQCSGTMHSVRTCFWKELKKRPCWPIKNLVTTEFFIFFVQIMHKGCACKFLYGGDTEDDKKLKIEKALEEKNELKLEIKFYKKNGKLNPLFWTLATHLSRFILNKTVNKWSKWM